MYFHVKRGALQLAELGFFILSYSCIMARSWPTFKFETSCHIINFFVKCVLVVVENMDR
jgi:hypothetical protein